MVRRIKSDTPPGVEVSKPRPQWEAQWGGKRVRLLPPHKPRTGVVTWPFRVNVSDTDRARYETRCRVLMDDSGRLDAFPASELEVIE